VYFKTFTLDLTTVTVKWR